MKKLSEGIASGNNMYTSYKLDAKRRGFEFSISREYFFEITKLDCHYCGAKPSPFAMQGKYNGPYIGNGIDRQNSSLGYIVGNCLACCKHCNRAKMDRSYEDFMDWIQLIIRYNNK